MTGMAVAAKKLDVSIGDLVEIDVRRYDVMSDKDGGVTLEPAIAVGADELHERYGSRRVTRAEFGELFGRLS